MSLSLRSLRELDPEARAFFMQHVLQSLEDSRTFASTARWARACVVWTTDGTTVKEREDFAGWLRANDLGSLARDVASRRLGRDGRLETLVYIEHDSGELAGVHIFAIDVMAELRAINRERAAPASPPEKETHRD